MCFPSTKEAQSRAHRGLAGFQQVSVQIAVLFLYGMPYMQ